MDRVMDGWLKDWFLGKSLAGGSSLHHRWSSAWTTPRKADEICENATRIYNYNDIYIYI